MNLNLKFDGEPRAVQSVRFAKVAGFMRKYQPKEVVDWKNYIMIMGKSQLPANHRLFAGPLRVEVEFRFQPLKSWPKKKLAALESGAMIRKTSKPDLTDNLMKGLIDALSGVVWEADQQICEVSSRKIYALTAGTTLKVIELEEISQPTIPSLFAEEWGVAGKEPKEETLIRAVLTA